MVSGYWWKILLIQHQHNRQHPRLNQTRTTNNLLEPAQPSQPWSSCPTPAESVTPTPAPSDKTWRANNTSWATKHKLQVLTYQKNPPINESDSEFWSIQTIYRNANETKARTPATPAIQTTPGLVTTEEPRKPNPWLCWKPAEGLEQFWLGHQMDKLPNWLTHQANQVMQSSRMIKTTTDVVHIVILCTI